MKQSTIVRYKEDDIILEQGSSKREMFKILGGKAMVYFNYGQPDEYLVGILSAPHCFGELSLLSVKPSVYTVVAYCDAAVMRITKENFGAFIKQNPQNAIDIMNDLANTISTLSKNLNMLCDDLKAVTSAKANVADVADLTDISMRISQYSSPAAISKALFTHKV